MQHQLLNPLQRFVAIDLARDDTQNDIVPQHCSRIFFDVPLKASAAIVGTVFEPGPAFDFDQQAGAEYEKVSSPFPGRMKVEFPFIGNATHVELFG